MFLHPPSDAVDHPDLFTVIRVPQKTD